MSLFVRGCNNLPYYPKRLGKVPKRLLPVVKYNEDGSSYIVYETEKVVDYGSFTDYNLEDMQAAGVTPPTIRTGSSSRLDVSDDLSAFESAADSILTNSNSN